MKKKVLQHTVDSELLFENCNYTVMLCVVYMYKHENIVEKNMLQSFQPAREV